MKKLLGATAIVLIGATSAFAATEADLLTIQRYVPEATMADLDAMGDEKVASIINAANSGDEAQARKTVKALFEDASAPAAMATAPASDGFASEGNLVTIQNYIPEVTMADLRAMGDEKIASLLNVISGDKTESEKRETARALYDEMMGATTATAAANDDFANEANLSKIQQFVPSVTMADLRALGNQKIASVLNAISSGMSDAEVRQTVEGLLGS